MRRMIFIAVFVGCIFMFGGFTQAEDTEVVLDSADGSSAFVIQDSNTKQVLGAASDGNIGIGTAAPQAKLDILGSNNQLILRTKGIWSSIYACAGAANTGALIFSSADAWLESRTGNLRFAAGGIMETAERMTILSSGKVGIGTANPGTKLDVAGKVRIGTGGATAGSEFNVTGGAYNQVNITHDSSWGLLLGYGNGSLTGNYHGLDHAAIINVKNAPLHLGTNNNSRVTILGNGNVGIGTAGPQEKLQVNGKIKAKEFITGDIIFTDKSSGKVLWRMFEDEEGLYLESAKTKKVYRFLLEEVK